MVSSDIWRGSTLRIAIGIILIVLLAGEVSAAINATSVEIRGQVWNESEPVRYWNPINFAGFFYDIKDNLGTENLTILQPDLSSWQRMIAKSNLIYSTQAQPRGLKVADALGLTGNNAGLTARGLEQAAPGKAFDQGLYWMLGWQGEKYVAVNGKVDRLSKLILEQRSSADVKNLTVGETWNIGDGWVLKVNSTNIITAPKKVQLILSKDGIKKNETVINESMIYTYVERNLSNETDVPLFVTYVSNISIDAVQLKYTWAISDSIIQINSGDTYGVFKDAMVAGKTLALSNTDTTVILARGTTISLMGKLNFRVADSDILRFYPMVVQTEPGTYEVRGSVWNDTSIKNANYWNPMNFAGFFYDINENLGNEKLTILQNNLCGSISSTGCTQQRTIDKNNLTYSTAAQAKALKVASALGLVGDNIGLTMKGLEQAAPGKAFDQGLYWILGWQGEKYVAVNGKVDKLSKLIIEHGTAAAEKKTLTVGETWDIGDGWELTANSIDAKATPRQVWLTLSKDGIKKDDKVVSSGTTDAKPIYTYVEKSIGGETDVPVFVTYVDSIFAGATTDMVQLRYTWAISESVTQINSGSTYGVFKDAVVSGKTLALKNTDTAVSLTRESIIDLMGSMNFKVADSDTLRFYPFVTYEIPHTPPPPPPPKPFDTMKFEPYTWNLVSVPRTLIN
ncbi:MAG: hypothetical protein KKG76_04235 [Euryarchaeota archaeon]|nr:hypothetical protein [Euryarchaeota archaeon]